MLQRSHITAESAADSLCAADGGAGLVTSAITPETPSDASELLDGLSTHFRFPGAELVAAAAAMFDAERTTETAWYRRDVPEPSMRENGVELPGVDIRYAYTVERHARLSYLTIGPGLVKISRADPQLKAAREERARDARRRDTDRLISDAKDGREAPDDGPARVVSAWSAKSRARLVETVASLDLSTLVTGKSIPCMVTLTLPGDWLAVAPDAPTAAAHLDNFARTWQDRWGTRPQWIWKREFQRRGAPHWHIWTVPPTTDSRAFRRWLSEAWTNVIKPSADPVHGTHNPHVDACDCAVRCVCGCSERCRSISAGTGVDYAEGMRARDPRRLAVYFLKETLGGEGKAYQNGPPPQWDGQSVGRFWGVRGIAKATATVAVSADAHAVIWRDLRRARLASRPMREVRATWQATACAVAFEEYPDPTTGELRAVVVRGDEIGQYVKRRPVKRRAVVRGSAGWSAVNDGADYAAQLARLLDPPTTAPWSRRDPSTMPFPAVNLSTSLDLRPMSTSLDV